MDSKNFSSQYLTTDWKKHTTCNACGSLIEYSEKDLRRSDLNIYKKYFKCPKCHSNTFLNERLPPIVSDRVEDDITNIENGIVICYDCYSITGIDKYNINPCYGGGWDRGSGYTFNCLICKHELLFHSSAFFDTYGHRDDEKYQKRWKQSYDSTFVIFERAYNKKIKELEEECIQSQREKSHFSPTYSVKE